MIYLIGYHEWNKTGYHKGRPKNASLFLQVCRQGKSFGKWHIGRHLSVVFSTKYHENFFSSGIAIGPQIKALNSWPSLCNICFLKLIIVILNADSWESFFCLNKLTLKMCTIPELINYLNHILLKPNKSIFHIVRAYFQYFLKIVYGI